MKKPLYLVIIGPSGCGKGTQAKLLAKKYGLVHIVVGDLLRGEIRKGTKLGQKVASCVKQGRWVPSKLTLKICKPYLEKGFRNGFIIDGLPRRLKQAKLLEAFLNKRGVKLNTALLLQVRPKVILERKKAVEKKGKRFQKDRADDTFKLLKNRLRSYKKSIGPVVRFYKERGLLFKIDGERPVKPIYKEIVKKLESFSN